MTCRQATRILLHHKAHPLTTLLNTSATLRPLTSTTSSRLLSASTASNSAAEPAAAPAATVTPLYDFHVERGGKMVNFGGYMLPVQYNDLSIVNSHLHTRRAASIFDVSHMLQTEIIGPDCVPFLESVVTADLQKLEREACVLTVFTDEQGGILDDLIVTKVADDHLFVVSNAARREHDQGHLMAALEKHQKSNPKSKINIKFFDTKERALIAVQGPQAAQMLQPHVNVDLSKLYFMQSSVARVTDVWGCRLTRCGYTGEDGFEISVPAIKVVDITSQLMKNNVDLKLAGLGARDSLRLEAGLCLYGSDLTTETTPTAAGLNWLVAKRRRELRNFPGAEAIVSEITKGVAALGRRRVGLVSTQGGPPARHDTEVLSADGTRRVGIVTSGCPAPSLKQNVAMAYVDVAVKMGDAVKLKIREKLYDAVLSRMPFLPANYYNKPK